MPRPKKVKMPTYTAPEVTLDEDAVKEVERRERVKERNKPKNKVKRVVRRATNKVKDVAKDLFDMKEKDPAKHKQSQKYHYELGKKTAQAKKPKGETSDNYGPYASDYEAGYHSVKEELTGDQHKIDANKNNKIDAHDFKLLRKLKKARG